MAGCDYLINSAIGGNCENPLVDGYRREAVILNADDILSYTVAGSAPRGQFSAIVRKATTLGYAVTMEGDSPFAGTAKEGVTGVTGTRTQKTVKFMFADAGLTADNIIDKLQNGKFVMVLQPLHGGSDAKSYFEIIGKESPLYFSAVAQDRTSKDNFGAFDVTLTCVEPHTGNYLWAETKVATTALYEALKTAATV